MRIITSGRGKGEGADQIRELGEEATGRSVSHVIMNDMLAKFYLDNQLETKVIFAYGHLFCFAIFVFVLFYGFGRCPRLQFPRTHVHVNNLESAYFALYLERSMPRH